MRKTVCVLGFALLAITALMVLEGCGRSERSTRDTRGGGLGVSAPAGAPQDFQNDPRVRQATQEPDEMEKAIAELPESSAIRTALRMKKLADEEDARRAERFERARSLARVLSLGFDQKALCDVRLLKVPFKDITNDELDACIGESGPYIAKLYPSYPSCASEAAFISEMPCAHQVFLAERVQEHKELMNALQLASYAGVKVAMSHRFTKEPEQVSIDINATNRQIVDFLLKGDSPKPARSQ